MTKITKGHTIVIIVHNCVIIVCNYCNNCNLLRMLEGARKKEICAQKYMCENALTKTTNIYYSNNTVIFTL